MAEGHDDLRAYRVKGHVQGVGFRWWTRRTAQTLGIRGTVRNASDGTVRVVAAGSRERLERFEAALESGPPAGRVDAVVRESPPGALEHDSFEIVL
jgi:acylphosphatase